VDAPDPKAVQHQYAHGEHRPLPGYLALIGGYSALAAAELLAARRRDTSVVDLGWGELALTAVATFRLSRILTKDAVTSPLRAPLTRYVEPGTSGEVNEEVAPSAQSSPGRHALAELVTCPFCLGQWVATAFAGGYVLAPGFTRAVTRVMALTAGADALQYVYSGLRRLEP
jgi:hypothetical protein